MVDFCSSSDFIALSASGPDWRSIASECVEVLDRNRTDGRPYTFGLIYVTEELAGDLSSLVTLLRNMTGVERWYGCSALGVFSGSGVHMGLPGVSILMGTRSLDLLCDLEGYLALRDLNPDPVPVALLHCLPDDHVLAGLMERTAHLYAVGGVASAREGKAVLTGEAQGDHAGTAGLVFHGCDTVQIALMRGWKPLHDGGVITDVQDNIVQTIENKPALQYMQDVIADAAVDLHSQGDHAQQPSIHVSLKLSHTDQNDTLIRNIVSVNEDEGTITLAHVPQRGEHISFVYRSLTTAGEDMDKALAQLKARLGDHEVTGAVYISCVARVDMLDTDVDEVEALRRVFGSIPLAGFYGVGELARSELRGYSGILLVFTKEEETR